MIVNTDELVFIADLKWTGNFPDSIIHYGIHQPVVLGPSVCQTTLYRNAKSGRLYITSVVEHAQHYVITHNGNTYLDILGTNYNNILSAYFDHVLEGL